MHWRVRAVWGWDNEEKLFLVLVCRRTLAYRYTLLRFIITHYSPFYILKILKIRLKSKIVSHSHVAHPLSVQSREYAGDVCCLLILQICPYSGAGLSTLPRPSLYTLVLELPSSHFRLDHTHIVTCSRYGKARPSPAYVP